MDARTWVAAKRQSLPQRPSVEQRDALSESDADHTSTDREIRHLRVELDAVDLLSCEEGLEGDGAEGGAGPGRVTNSHERPGGRVVVAGEGGGGRAGQQPQCLHLALPAGEDQPRLARPGYQPHLSHKHNSGVYSCVVTDLDPCSVAQHED